MSLQSGRLTEDIMKTMAQVTDGLQKSTGLNVPALLSGMMGAKLVDNQK